MGITWKNTWAVATLKTTTPTVTISGSLGPSLLVAHLSMDGGAPTTSGPTGFTKVGGLDSAGAVYLEVWQRELAASESADGAIAWVGPSEEYAITVLELAGTGAANMSAPVFSAGTSQFPTPTVVYPATGDWVISGDSVDNGLQNYFLYAAPHQGTELSNLITTGGGSGSVSQIVSYKEEPWPGSNFPAGEEYYSLASAEQWVAFNYILTASYSPVEATAHLAVTTTVDATFTSAELVVNTSMDAKAIIGDVLEVTDYRFQQGMQIESDPVVWEANLNTDIQTIIDTTGEIPGAEYEKVGAFRHFSDGTYDGQLVYTVNLRFLVKNISGGSVSFAPRVYTNYVDVDNAWKLPHKYVEPILFGDIPKAAFTSTSGLPSFGVIDTPIYRPTQMVRAENGDLLLLMYVNLDSLYRIDCYKYNESTDVWDLLSSPYSSASALGTLIVSGNEVNDSIRLNLGGIYKTTTDNGLTWETAPNNYRAHNSPYNGDVLYAHWPDIDSNIGNGSVWQLSDTSQVCVFNLANLPSATWVYSAGLRYYGYAKQAMTVVGDYVIASGTDARPYEAIYDAPEHKGHVGIFAYHIPTATYEVLLNSEVDTEYQIFQTYMVCRNKDNPTEALISFFRHPELEPLVNPGNVGSRLFRFDSTTNTLTDVTDSESSNAWTWGVTSSNLYAVTGTLAGETKTLLNATFYASIGTNPIDESVIHGGAWVETDIIPSEGGYPDTVRYVNQFSTVGNNVVNSDIIVMKSYDLTYRGRGLFDRIRFTRPSDGVTVSIFSKGLSSSNDQVELFDARSDTATSNGLATLQKIGSGTYQATNTAFISNGRSDVNVVNLAVNEEVEVVAVISIEWDKSLRFPENFPGGDIKFKLESDSVGVFKSTSLTPIINISKPKTHAAASGLNVIATIKASLPPFATLNSVTSIAALGGNLYESQSSMHVLTNIEGSSLEENAFQTVLTQFFNEDGAEVSAPLIGAPNLPLNINVNSDSAQNFYWTSVDYTILTKMRWLVRNTSGASILFNPLLQVRKNNGTWKEIEVLSTSDVTGFTEHTYHTCYRGVADGADTGLMPSILAYEETAWEGKLYPAMQSEVSSGNRFMFWYGDIWNGLTYGFSGNIAVSEANTTTGVVTQLSTNVFLTTDTNDIAPAYVDMFSTIAMSNSDVYVMCLYTNTTEAAMKKYDSINGWVEITGHGFASFTQATSFLYQMSFFEYNNTLYGIGWHEYNDTTSSVGIVSFNGTTWSLEAQDNFHPAEGAYRLGAIVLDKTTGVINYLLSNHNNEAAYPVYRATYTIGTQAFTTPVQQWAAGNVRLQSNVGKNTVIDEPTSYSANIYVTFAIYTVAPTYGRLYEFSKVTGEWSFHSTELVYAPNTTHMACMYWTNNKFVLVGALTANSTKMFEYDSVSSKYIAHIGYNLPSYVYISGTYTSALPMVYYRSGSSEPDLYVASGSGFFHTSSQGYYVKGYSQDLEFSDQHWTDTTKQLPSDNTYAYLAANNANVTRSPYIEAQLTLANNEEVELSFSLQINKTQLDAAGIDSVLEYRLFNQNTTYPIENRNHYPTINYTVYDEHSAQSNLNIISAISATAVVSQSSDVLGYSDLLSTVTIVATATKTAGFKLGQANLHAYVTDRFSATHYIGSYWHWPMVTNVQAIANVTKNSVSALNAIASVSSQGTNIITAVSNNTAFVNLNANGSYIHTAISNTDTEININGIAIFDIYNSTILNTVCSVQATDELVTPAYVTLHNHCRLTAANSQFIFSGGSDLSFTFNILAAPTIIRPVSAALDSSTAFTAASTRFATTDTFFGINTALAFTSLVDVSAATELSIETGLGGTLLWDDNRDIILFSCYINRTQDFDIPGGVYCIDKYITTRCDYNMNILSNIYNTAEISTVTEYTFDINTEIHISSDLAREDPHLVDVDINMNKSFNLGIIPILKIDNNITNTIVYDLHIKQDSTHDIDIGY